MPTLAGAPGASTELIDQVPPPSNQASTATRFIVGLAAKGTISGPLTSSDAITSLQQWINTFGALQSYNGNEYAAVEGYFAEGGSQLYYSRKVGPNPVAASITVPSISSQGTFTAKSVGDYANTGTVTITDGVVTVVVDGVTETSPALTTVQDLIDWAATSTLIDYTPSVAGATALSDSTERTLAGGDDDRANITDTEITTALTRFGADLGPGQVSLPGDTRDAARGLLADHATATNRIGLWDGPDSATVSSVVASAGTARDAGRESARHVFLLDGWGLAPPVTPGGSQRVVPPCASFGGLCARVDAGGNPNVAVAGRNAISRWLIGVHYPRTDDDRASLAAAGVIPFIVKDAVVQPYDDVTPVDPDADPEWLGAAGNRFVMRIVQDATAIADAHMFGAVTGQVDYQAFGDDLATMLRRWRTPPTRALWGDTDDEAFRVETGPSVNTPDVVAARQLKAALGLKIAPNARQVIVQIANTPLTSAL